MMTELTSVTSTGAMAAVRAAPAAPPQAPTQIPGEAEGGTIMILLILGFLWYILKHKKAKVPHVIASFVAGVLLAGSMFGLMARQVSASLGTGVQTMFSTITTTGGGGGGGSGR